MRNVKKITALDNGFLMLYSLERKMFHENNSNRETDLIDCVNEW